MEETKEIIGTTFADLRPAFDLIHLRTGDGYQYAFNKNTPGINFNDVKEGQTYRCIVTKKFARVLKAELI